MNKKDVNYYMNLPYHFIIKYMKNENCYFGKIIELNGCESTANSIEELYNIIYNLMKGFIEVKLEYDDPIPEPINDKDFTMLIIPKSLYKKLNDGAKKDKVSLNQYALHKLSN